MNLISLSLCKTLLGISGATSDTLLNIYIPIVSADVRRILGNDFSSFFYAAYEDGSTSLVLTDYKDDVYNDNEPPVKPRELIGKVVTGENLTDDTYITAWDPNSGAFTMSQAATGSGVFVYPTLSYGSLPALAQMVYYRVAGTSTTRAKDVKSKSIEGVSVTFGDSEQIVDGYPRSLIEQLGPIYARVV